MPFYKHQKYDAIIVLANLMDKLGVLNDETRSRVDLAIDALKSGCAPVLVACGWAYREDSEICIADAMRQYAMSTHKVEDAALITEVHSRDTVGDAIFTKINLATPRDWKKILVVTSNYHAERSRAIFSFVYGPSALVDATGADVPDNEQLRNNEAVSMKAFLGTFEGINAGDDKKIFSRLRERHPFYNGQVYPEIPEMPL